MIPFQVLTGAPDSPRDARLQAFVGSQSALWSGAPGDWVVLPSPDNGGPALIAVDVEGERRGREVLSAFLGPGVASLASTAQQVPVADGVVRRVDVRVRDGQGQRALEALELLVSARLGITRHTVAPQSELADLLRDMRLGLATGDTIAAGMAYEAIDRLGLLSRENRRFLEVEYLAESERWLDLVKKPYFSELPVVRRPRLVTEYLLDAVWNGIVLRSGQAAATAMVTENVFERFAPLLAAPDVPRRPGALALVYLSAVLQGDESRVGRIVSSIPPDERDRLEALKPVTAVAPPAAGVDVTTLLARGMYGSVVEAFLESPRQEWVDAVVESVLELQDPDGGRAVLEEIDRFIATGLDMRPRLARALDEVRALVAGQCNDWLDWAKRTADGSWDAAAAVAREESAAWIKPSGPSAVEFADLLLTATTGENSAAVSEVLDVLLRLARDCLVLPSGQTVGDAVLLVLAEQDNASEAVRSAFIDLASLALDQGMSAGAYRAMVQAAVDLWSKVASPLAFDWALEVLEALAVSPCPEPGLPASLASVVQGRGAAWVGRLSDAQRASMRSLTSEFGLQPWPGEVPSEEEASVWSALNGRSLGLYSLIENAGTRLNAQLAHLCSLSQFTHNRDHTATAALASLAERADYLIVDTWHAAHQATGCIDQHRARDRQILPPRGSTPALLRALEEWLRTRQGVSAQ